LEWVEVNIIQRSEPKGYKAKLGGRKLKSSVVYIGKRRAN